jgi:hypothetical protein
MRRKNIANQSIKARNKVNSAGVSLFENPSVHQFWLAEGFFMPLSQKFPYKPKDQIHDCAQQYHGGNWEEKPEILFFHPDITGKFSKPLKFVVEQVNAQTESHDDCTCEDDIFACVLRHHNFFAKLSISNYFEINSYSKKPESTL